MCLAVCNECECSTGHTLNGQPLLEFAHPHDLGGGAGTQLRVKAATLWVRVDFRSPLHRAFRHNVPDKNLTLWIFTVTQHLHTNTTHLSGKVCCCNVTYNETLPAGEGQSAAVCVAQFPNEEAVALSCGPLADRPSAPLNTITTVHSKWCIFCRVWLLAFVTPVMTGRQHTFQNPSLEADSFLFMISTLRQMNPIIPITARQDGCYALPCCMPAVHAE